MKKTLMVLVLAAFVQVSFAEDERNDANAWEERYQQLERKVDGLSRNMRKLSRTIKRLTDENDKLRLDVDSLSGKCNELAGVQNKDREDVSGKIEQTNASVESNTSSLKSRTYWGIGVIVVIVLIIIGIYLYISRRIKKGDVSIADMRKAQGTLQEAQTQFQETQSKLQEESIKLDNTFIEIIEKQLKAVPVAQTGPTPNAPDHSLALKVADEIVRIEMNLTRMDPAVKGHKQLSKAVQRLRDNFKANGYEIVEMLGKPYDEGMKVIANFVPDDSLAEGQQIITGITKPQINYNGKMIQAAQITVSQNI